MAGDQALLADEAIDLVELRGLVHRLFDALERAGVRSLPVHKAYYWSLFPSESFESNEPPEPGLRDVLDDVLDFRKEVDGNDPENVLLVSHAFYHLSGLMNFIAYADMKGDVGLVERREAA